MILVFGTVCIDRVRTVPNLPPPGGYVEITEETDFLGGEAANTATVLKAWRVEILLLGNELGDGPEGDILRGLVRDKGLPLASLLEGEQAPPTPVCDIYVTPDGERTMFGKNFKSMEAGLTASSIPNHKGEWFTAEPNMIKLSAEAAALAHSSGKKIYLMDFMNPGSIPPGSFWQCSTDWTGTRGNVQKNVEWVREWIEQTGSFAILSDGPNGFVAGSPAHPVRAYPPYPAPKVVDTTGAGDMFRAGMLFGLSQDWPVSKCLQFASAAGCLKCRSLGATSDIPSVEEIKAHIQSHSSVSQQYI